MLGAKAGQSYGCWMLGRAISAVQVWVLELSRAMGVGCWVLELGEYGYWSWASLGTKTKRKLSAAMSARCWMLELGGAMSAGARQVLCTGAGQSYRCWMLGAEAGQVWVLELSGAMGARCLVLELLGEWEYWSWAEL